jgi:hypothetical protein
MELFISMACLYDTDVILFYIMYGSYSSCEIALCTILLLLEYCFMV